MVQCSRKLKTLDKKRLLQKQNEHRIKYGLKPHKRLDKDFLYLQKITDLQSKNETQKDDEYRGSYQ
jgi:hypothetical protein